MSSASRMERHWLSFRIVERQPQTQEARNTHTKREKANLISCVYNQILKREIYIPLKERSQLSGTFLLLFVFFFCFFFIIIIYIWVVIDHHSLVFTLKFPKDSATYRTIILSKMDNRFAWWFREHNNASFNYNNHYRIMTMKTGLIWCEENSVWWDSREILHY